MRRFKHSLSHYNLTTCDMGQLVPVGCYEVLPGDTVQQRTSALIRSLPLNLPVMHPVQVRIHSFFVPNRILWDEWEDFITGGDYSETWTYPTITSTDTKKNLEDYLGIPRVAGLELSALPFRAYNLIYNEFYRDQDLAPEVGIDDTEIKRVSWAKDYFAGARPWTQKGPDVTIPLGDRANVTGIGKLNQDYIHPDIQAHETGGNLVTYPDSAFIGQDPNQVYIREDANNPGFPDIYADLSDATGANINDVRKAFAIQRYQEARARYGSRYTEYLRYLGITPSDARLQRPEYLGGGRQTIAYSEVLQTAEGDPQGGNAPTDGSVGMFRGHGISAVRSRRFRRFFEEHGHVLTLMSVRPKTVYNEALHKMWSRRTREEYYQKELEAIGQQEVFSREIYAEPDAGGTGGDAIFGYADRYREYREHPSYTSGEMRVGEFLDAFHLGRSFESPPTLNQSFVECVPSKRIYKFQESDSLWCLLNHQVQARRMVNRSAAARVL